jgi:hypothetical protein
MIAAKPAGATRMHVREYALFPTRLVTIQFDEVDGVNRDLYALFAGRDEFAEHFDMHPDSLNLLALAAGNPAIARLRGMFLDGLRQWLRSEGVKGEFGVEMVMFSNYAQQGDFTQVHNHNADVVGIYYARTAEYDQPAIVLPDPDNYDYFAADDGVLTLHDPRFNANLAAVRVSDYARVFPRPGLMLLFPGYLWHSVTPHLGEFRRLALSVNFRLSWPAAAPAERVKLSIGAEDSSVGPISNRPGE